MAGLFLGKKPNDSQNRTLLGAAFTAMRFVCCCAAATSMPPRSGIYG
jgi:hypothetical protein